MSNHPLVGITTYPAGDNGRFSAPRAYVDAVRRGGGEAVLLTPGLLDPVGLVDRLDGIVLTGGADVGPSRYGHPGHPTVYGVDDERDTTELAAIERVLEIGLPALAICRGHQLLNVALGGTLHPHLPEVVDGSIEHRDAEAVAAGRSGAVPHPVTVAAGSLLARTMGATDVVPMSWHHQAVDRPGCGLRIVGRAPDGTIEALEHDTHPLLLCVQWHPELSAATDPTQQALFDALVVAARTHADDRRLHAGRHRCELDHTHPHPHVGPVVPEEVG